jgi:enterochelin esterase-like enzyme
MSRLQHLAFLGLFALAVASAPFSATVQATVERVEPTAVAESSQSNAAQVIPTQAAAPLETTDAPATASQTDASEAPRPKFIALPGGTTVSPERFYSQSLKNASLYEVILPPGYDRDSRRYPVLYLLHGAAGGANEWVEIGIHKAADGLWSAGAIEPFIIVLPEGGSSYWLNHADGGPRWGDYVVEDLVREIDSTYRTVADRDHRAIGGLSMGGDGALQLALNRPDVFGIAGGHSPTTRLTYDRRPGAFYGDETYWQHHNPLWLIQNKDTARLLKIWIDMGDDDVWLPSAEALHEALLDQDVEHQYAELPGSHEAEYWIGYQDQYLRFYAEAFTAADPVHATRQAVETIRQ